MGQPLHHDRGHLPQCKRSFDCLGLRTMRPRLERKPLGHCDRVGHRCDRLRLRARKHRRPSDLDSSSVFSVWPRIPKVSRSPVYSWTAVQEGLQRLKYLQRTILIHFGLLPQSLGDLAVDVAVDLCLFREALGRTRNS